MVSHHGGYCLVARRKLMRLDTIAACVGSGTLLTGGFRDKEGILCSLPVIDVLWG